MGVRAVKHHLKKVRFFATVDLVHALEQEKVLNKAGQFDPRRRPGVDLMADQLMRHRVEKSADLDMIIQRDAGKAPFGEFIIRLGQFSQSRALDRLEQMPPVEPKLAHDMRVDAYGNAIIEAGAETGLAESTFPADCPWSFEQTMADDFWPGA